MITDKLLADEIKLQERLTVNLKSQIKLNNEYIENIQMMLNILTTNSCPPPPQNMSTTTLCPVGTFKQKRMMSQQKLFPHAARINGLLARGTVINSPFCQYILLEVIKGANICKNQEYWKCRLINDACRMNDSRFVSIKFEPTTSAGHEIGLDNENDILTTIFHGHEHCLELLERLPLHLDNGLCFIGGNPFNFMVTDYLIPLQFESLQFPRYLLSIYIEMIKIVALLHKGRLLHRNIGWSQFGFRYNAVSKSHDLCLMNCSTLIEFQDCETEKIPGNKVTWSIAQLQGKTFVPRDDFWTLLLDFYSIIQRPRMAKWNDMTTQEHIQDKRLWLAEQCPLEIKQQWVSILQFENYPDVNKLLQSFEFLLQHQF